MVKNFGPGNKKDADAIRRAAKVRERLFSKEPPDGHIVILTFEGVEPVAGYSKVVQSLPPDFAEAAMDLHGLDINVPRSPLP